MVSVAPSHLALAKVAVALATLLLLDKTWFYFVFDRVYWQLKGVQIKWWWGFLAWVPLAVAIASARPETLWEAGGWGAAVGFTTYAVFNGTELAIRSHEEEWSPTPALIDLMWGTTACTLSACATYHYA